MHEMPLPLRTLSVLWSAFLVAAVLELLVFALVDPGDLRWFGGGTLGWPPNAVYTIAFFVFWAVAAAGAALALLLCSPAHGAAGRSAR
ncbi:MAG TPA: hypothetical protein PLB41_03000 [Rubrivivax sp.]|nr:hypothetical protein [Rubrivivax sp.]HPO20724.1 hypothetical protein [Rubrivivax sp.]